tara:strand:- start:1036 stop:1956 length:921 start_codon:yes stop_codon:yes gene_type:complete
MSSIPYNYKPYIDAKVSMTDNGTVDAGRQMQSPASAGSRGMAKTMQFSKNKTQMQLGQETIAESMVEIRSILNRIDGVNAPVQEDAGEKIANMAQNMTKDQFMSHADELGLTPEEAAEHYEKMQGGAHVQEAPKQSDIDYTKLMLDISAMKDRIAELPIDDDAKTSALTALGQVEDDLSMDEHEYTPFPEGDEFDIEEDEDFEEVLGPLGFPEDETELFDAEYQGRKVPLNKPMRGDVKKFKVYVKDPKTGNVKKVNFGHGGTSAKRPTMRIRKSNPKARKSFRARHNCANPGPKTKARYWSCRKW